MAGIDPFLTPTIVRFAAENYANLTPSRGLGPQIDDEFVIAASEEILSSMEFGADLLSQARKIGYQIKAVDMRSYNLIASDLNKTNSLAVCYPDKRIFIGVYQGLDPVIATLFMAHEIGHIIQWHFFADTTLKNHSGLMEAHSSAIEFIIAEGMLDKGYDLAVIRDCLLKIPHDDVDILCSKPDQFISKVGTSDYVRNLWKFSEEQMLPSKIVAQKFADKLPTLKRSWKTSINEIERGSAYVSSQPLLWPRHQALSLQRAKDRPIP